MQGPEGHGKNSVLFPKSNVLLKVIKHKGNISEMYYSAMKNGLKESLEKAKEVSLQAIKNPMIAIGISGMLCFQGTCTKINELRNMIDNGLDVESQEECCVQDDQ